jgi:L-lactate dehydrogenase complex protein LldG
VSARDEVLRRIRTALGPDRSEGSGPVPDGYRTRAGLSTAELVDRLAERLADYRATVRRAAPDQLAGAIGAALADRGARRLVVPPGLDLPGLDLAGLALAGLALAGVDLPGSHLAGAGVELVVDDGLSARELDGFDGVITTAAVAIADTGTIILDGSAAQGRRALSLIPDYHLCVVRADQVVGLVPEAVARLRPDRPLTWISGPSATSDIELDRVEGVHGPRTLDVILTGP